LYSQVFWKGLPPVDLPKTIVEKFHGKGMAVVGFEMDQVRRVKQKDGTTKDVSVPLNVAYNHHFESNMIGQKASFKNVQFSGPNDPRLVSLKNRMGGHGVPSDQSHWMVVENENENENNSDLPSSQAFGGANGGEYRLSYHGYAPGYAQVIESPTQFQITPMQIDTWNRDKMNLTGPTKFVPGPVPRNSLAPTSGPDAYYSGLLECPLTTRVQKNIQTTYTINNGNNNKTCNDIIKTVEECGAAAKRVLGNGTRFSSVTRGDTNHPFGCSATSDENDASLAHVYYRNEDSKTSSPTCSSGTTLRGTTQSLVNVSITMLPKENKVHITLKGPSTVWFGIGFNASAMKDEPWAIIVEGGSNGNITERKLRDQNPGILLSPPSISVVSTSIANGMKTVVIERSLIHSYYTFQPNVVELRFINAVGRTQSLSYHKVHSPGLLTFLPIDQSITGGSSCICEGKTVPFGQGKGTFTYIANTSQTGDVGSGTTSFVNKCSPQPRSDLLSEKNPTCDARSYVGGQIVCHHMWSLLDSDQEIPWPDQPLEYHLKFRFWVQEYNASYHHQISRSTWGIASPVEYDVPKCTKGMIGCSINPIDGTWMHKITGTYQGQGKLVAAHFHCHAPTCLSISMYRCNKNVSICNETNGELLCEEKPIYGGTGKIPIKKFDEAGFIIQPPCLWGSSEDGLESPVDVDPNKYILGSVKYSNATHGHHGEMAWQQMYLLR
jgi:hypothetical protein